MKRSFELVANSNFEKHLSAPYKEQQLLKVHSLRILLHLAILSMVLVYQVIQGPFINVDVWMPIYLVIGSVLFLNSLYLVFFERLYSSKKISATLFALDCLAITIFIYFTGAKMNVFSLLYLVNIFLGGLIFSPRGALLIALWSSFLLSFLLIESSSGMVGQSLYVGVVVNNLVFAAVAFLSGQLSEQINFMGEEIAEQKDDLRALKNLNALIVDNIATGLMTLDESRTLTHINQAGLDILDQEGLIGRPISTVFPGLEKDLRRHRPVDEKNRATRIEVKYVNRFQEEMDVEVLASTLRDANKKTVGHLLLFQDLTRIKHMEDRLRQKEKLAAVGQLAAGIAHEIRNPLASISGSIQMMVGDQKDMEPEQQRLMAIVIREIDRLNGLVTEFLDYVSPNKQERDPVDVNQLLSGVLEMVRYNKTLSDDVQQKVELKSQGWVRGSQSKLQQAFLNIVINAYQAMDESDTAVLEVFSYDDAGRVVVLIRDSGSGISKENISRIFEPFHTTKHKGTGLGLAMTHKILEAHGAHIDVKSETGKGTDFIIDFPGDKGPEADEAKVKLYA